MRKLVLVSGGSRGIGKAIVLRFLEEGFEVLALGRNPEHLEKLKEECLLRGQKLHVAAVDLAQKKEVLALGEKIQNLGLKVSVLVNNAGLFLPGSIGQEEDGVFETLIQTNLASAYHLTRLCLPDLESTENSYIFTICSTASIVPYVNGGSYCISKFGLLGMSKVLREELKPKGVRVTAVLPGATLTDSWAGAGLPPERFMPPEDIAQAIWDCYQMSPRTCIEELLVRPQLGDI